MSKSRIGPEGPAARAVDRVAKDVASQIKKIMKDQGLSYSELGMRMHLSTQKALTLLNWTHHAPSLYDLAKAADALEATLMVGSWEVVPAKSKKGKQK